MTAERTVVFVCEHGAAKSVIAAAYLPGLAAARGIPVRTLARGTDPDPTISPAAVAGLRSAGLPIPEHDPCRPTVDELASAWAVISFGPPMTGAIPDGVHFVHWPDVPSVSDGFDAARDAIVAHLGDLLADLDGGESADDPGQG